jgi:hypothetical protein
MSAGYYYKNRNNLRPDFFQFMNPLTGSSDLDVEISRVGSLVIPDEEVEEPARNTAEDARLLGAFFADRRMTQRRKQAIADIAGLVVVRETATLREIAARVPLSESQHRYAVGFLAGRLPVEHNSVLPAPEHAFIQGGITLDFPKGRTYSATPLLHQLASEAEENCPLLWQSMQRFESIDS